MIKIPNLMPRSLAVWACCLLGSTLPAAAQITWNFNTDTPTSGIPANLSVGAISQGNNNATGANPPLLSSVSVSNNAGASGGSNAGIAARIGALNTDAGGSAYFEVTLTPDPGFIVNLSGLSFGTRSTGTGPQAYTLRSNADDYTADVTTATLFNNSTWTVAGSNSFLLSSSAPLTLRLYGHNGSGTAGAGAANFRIDDLVLTVDVVATGGTPPTVVSFSPDNGFPGTVVTIDGTLFGTTPSVRFNGTIAPGATVNGTGTRITATVPATATTGPILVSTSGGSAASASPFTVLQLPSLALTTSATFVPENATLECQIARPADSPSLAALIVTLSSSNPERAVVPASVVIPSGDLFGFFNITGVQDFVFGDSVNVIISATATGYNKATASVAVTNVDSPPPPSAPTVVINKWLNSGTNDVVELLVVGNGTPGGTVNMSGMILKDFSASLAGDGGGKRVFSNPTLFDAVPVGTIIVITAGTTSSPDVDSSDFLLRLGLSDNTYFSGTTGSFNIAAIEMVMLKAAGSAEAGVAGSIHALAGGTLASGSTGPATYPLYGTVTSAKLFATTTTTTTSAIASNSTSSIADFNGTDAIATSTLTVSGFGVANNPSNNGYIRSLRGITSLSGVGASTITNGTPADLFLGKNIFGRGLTGQTVVLNVLSDVSPGTLTRVSVAVPAAMGVPTLANVSVTGAGAGTPVVSVSGQNISITGTAITTINPAVISIKGLITPSPTGATADGRYAFTVNTAGPSGVLAPIAIPPAAVVIIPIESLRDFDEATGVPNDLNKIVAVSGVVTEENFNSAQLSGFIQDGNFGINVFSFTPSIATFIRGNRYIVTGTIIHFEGLTEISPLTASDVIDLGAATPPTPIIVTAAQLNDPLVPAFQENLEGRLITIPGLSYVSGTWADPTGTNPNNVVLSDGVNNVTIRISVATEANSPPLAYPASITGILSQSSTLATGPFGGYVLLPRDPADLVVDPVISGYATWAAGYPGIGAAENDADGDGQSNFLEYALGTIPDNRSSVQPVGFSMVSGKPGMAITKGSAAAVDPAVRYLIEGSTDLSVWINAGSPDTTMEQVVDDATNYAVQYLGTSPKFYFRLKVGPPPPVVP